jgi:ABC-type sugar transport system ATPase subunit
VIRVRGLTLRYGATTAVDAADLEVAAGSVHGLVGENGAGKSSLLRACVGLARADAGRVEIGGRALPRDGGVAAAERLGAGYVAQELAVCGDLSVAEQVTLGREPRTRAGFLDRRAARARCRELLARLDSDLDPDARVGALRAPDRKRVQIARALAAEPRVLLLDEPTAALDALGAAAVLRLARAQAAAGGAAVVVSHRLDEVLATCDRVTVLRDGRVVATRESRELDARALVREMAGRELPPAQDAAPRALGPPRLDLGAHGLGALRAGEILGLFGLVGAGRSRLVESIAAAHGCALVPEERAAKGLVPELSLRENLLLPAPACWLSPARERAETVRWIERLAIRAGGPDAPIGSLSGGNQQKVLLARALARAPRVLVLDEPTQGIDVAAKAEIHALVRSLAAEGAAILLSSSDLPEVLALADRVAVVRSGRVAGVLAAARASQPEVLALACGVAA